MKKKSNKVFIGAAAAMVLAVIGMVIHKAKQ